MTQFSTSPGEANQIYLTQTRTFLDMGTGEKERMNYLIVSCALFMRHSGGMQSSKNIKTEKKIQGR